MHNRWTGDFDLVVLVIPKAAWVAIIAAPLIVAYFV